MNYVMGRPNCEILEISSDDDECWILDGELDKPAEAANDIDGDESDELMVISEKGQVACRDYPHARNLCARYPFATNPHEKCCNLCYCYVCDTKAPCIYWGTGVSSDDHCHSSDKEEVWKRQRKRIKQGKHPLVALPVSTLVRARSLIQLMNNGSTQPYILANSNIVCPRSSQRNHHLWRVTADRDTVAHPEVSTSTLLPAGSNIRSNIQSDRANGRPVSPRVNSKKVKGRIVGFLNHLLKKWF